MTGWLGGDFSRHALVILFFAAYPGIYHVLVTSSAQAEMVALLPRPDTMVVVFYFGLFAMSFDFISGYTGYLSFGHAAFYGTGAYFVILAANGKIPLVPYDTPFMLLILLAGLLAVVVAALIGLVSFRLTGVYFAMITLGFAQVLYVFIRGWDYVASSPRDGPAVLGPDGAGPPAFNIGVPGFDSLNLTVGSFGDTVTGLFGFIDLTATEVSYYMIGLVALAGYLGMRRILNSPFGRVMVAIRENEERARAIGYSTYWYKLAAFSMSGFFAGVAGALFAGYRQSASPENSFYFLVTGDALIASLIGGFGTLAGGLYGWLFDETISEFLSKGGEGGGLLPYLREHLGDATLGTEIYNGLTVSEAIETFLNGHAELYVGLVFVLFVLYVPGGLLGFVRGRKSGRVVERVRERLRNLRS